MFLQRFLREVLGLVIVTKIHELTKVKFFRGICCLIFYRLIGYGAIQVDLVRSWIKSLSDRSCRLFQVYSLRMLFGI